MQDAQPLKMPASHYEELRTLAKNYWWHRTRRELILKQAAKHLRAIEAPSFESVIDVGCGVGTGLAELARELRSREMLSGSAQVIGIDHPSTADVLDTDAASTVNFFGADLESQQLPREVASSSAPRLWVCTDVLEHLKQPAMLTAAVSRAMSTQDLFLCTVPAFSFLWSQWDVKLGHLRRYTLPELRHDLGASGGPLKITGQGYLFSWAVLPGIFRRKQQAGDVEFPRVPAWMNEALATVGKLEISAGGMPFGTTAWISCVRS